MPGLRQLPGKLVPRRHFPNPRSRDLDDVVAMGDALSTDILIESYSYGIFPWPHEGLPMLWCCPRERGIIDFSDLNLPRSFQKFLKKTQWQVRFNTAFEKVISECAKAKRPGQSGTWIHEAMQKAYLQFHKDGHAHSIEIFEDETLVGGLYGVFVAGAFAGESMFYLKANASKLALYATVQHLHAIGFEWMDIQMLTPVTEQFGGKYLSKIDFLDLLQSSQAKYLKLAAEKRPKPFPPGVFLWDRG